MGKVARLQKRATRITATKLDLACGQNKKPDYFGIDMYEGSNADALWDLREMPWPIEDASVESIVCSHFFEHLDGAERMAFMDECWRILKVGAQLEIIVPYWSSMRSIQDPTHKWPPVCETSFLYFNKEWRDKEKLNHCYPVTCDFDFTVGYMLDPDVVPRNEEYRQFAIKHYVQAVSDLQIMLTKRG